MAFHTAEDSSAVGTSGQLFHLEGLDEGIWGAGESLPTVPLAESAGQKTATTFLSKSELS